MLPYANGNEHHICRIRYFMYVFRFAYSAATTWLLNEWNYETFHNSPVPIHYLITHNDWTYTIQTYFVTAMIIVVKPWFQAYRML